MMYTCTLLDHMFLMYIMDDVCIFRMLIISCRYDAMYDIISAFQCYTISVDVYFPFHFTLWMACFTFLLILCYCCCAHDNDVSHTLHREWGITAGIRAPGSNTCRLGYLSGSFRT